ncbi:MAG: dTDP-4-dehydrorhamnose reductase [Bacteroidetes bacterium]|nr:dTDP-4-dehydrorhamnose reductase [Bacteroidota bacterium]
MNILVTGSNGQLGCELRKLEPEYKAYKFFFTDVNELDITIPEKVEKFVKMNKIDCVINCAAFTNVENAENERNAASLINTTAVKNIAEICAKVDALLIHFSTDYVFDGKNHKPYFEGDTASPKNIYGKTKFEGEIEILFNAKRAIIIRTSWLYSSFGNNFVKTIIDKAQNNKLLDVIFDQIGTPTYARDLAKTVLHIIPNTKPKMRTEIYNFSNEGVASWYDFAKAIVEIKKLNCNVVPVLTKDFPSNASRPHFSVLNKSRIKKDFEITIPYWRDSLKECLELM